MYCASDLSVACYLPKFWPLGRAIVEAGGMDEVVKRSASHDLSLQATLKIQGQLQMLQEWHDAKGRESSWFKNK